MLQRFAISLTPPGSRALREGSIQTPRSPARAPHGSSPTCSAKQQQRILLLSGVGDQDAEKQSGLPRLKYLPMQEASHTVRNELFGVECFAPR